MNVRNRIPKISRKFYTVTDITAWIGYVATAAIILIVFVDVSGRYFFHRPLMGAYELVELIMAVVGGLAIMYATARQGHVIIDIIFTRFPKLTQKIMQYIYLLLGFAISILLAYNVYLYALRQLKPYPLTTDMLNIGVTPFALIFAVAVFLCALTFLIQILDQWAGRNEVENEGEHYEL